ncbi:helix-turn-helix domain-containing protein [Shimazuella alba]|uniref:HTH cro/C1-type domain-containing protein n=1 Tax=Shimazuella alba TaxID=2690964 RepID=A0A6I4VR73_9BACL|nr:helix-turn-helix transcriptional regulator [Shimazuella alba]MXQ52765.1 hypothetical protein [Shimazuella alba]
MVDLVRIGGILRAERRKLGKSIERLAEEIALGGTTISLIERGMPTVSLEKYQYYAETLGKGILFGMVNEADKKIIALKEQLEDIEEILLANPEKAFDDLKKLNQEEQIESIPILQPFFYHIESKYHLRKKELGLAQDSILQAIRIAEMQPELMVDNLISRCYLDLGVVYYHRDQFYQALHYTKKGLECYVEHENHGFYYSLLLLNKSIYLERLNLLEKSILCLEVLENHLQNNLSIEKEFRMSVIIQMYTIYASVLNKLRMNERALDHAKKGIRLAKINKSYHFLFTLWTQTAIIYESLGDLAKAERYYRKTLDLEISLQGKEHLFPFAFVNFAKLLIGKQQWKDAKQLIKQSVQICRKNNDNFQLVQSLLVFGEWYIQQDKYNQAVPLCLEAEALAKEYTFEELVNKSISSLCTCYDALQDNGNFLKYATKLYRIERGVS